MDKGGYSYRNTNIHILILGKHYFPLGFYLQKGGLHGLKNLYRIISLESFLSLLLNSEDRLVRPIDCWEDTYEGFLLRMIEQQDDKCREVVDRIYRDISKESVDKTIINLAKLIRCRFTCYCMCWSRKKDSDALWRIYSYDKKAIQLVSSEERISKTIADANFDEDNYLIEDIQYDEKDDMLSLRKLFEPSSKIHDTFLHKRTAFDHEKEVRVILHNVFDWDMREDRIKDDICRLSP